MRTVGYLLILVTLMAFGCSSGNPATPGQEGSSNPATISEGDLDYGQSALGIMGSYDLVIDPDTMDISFVSQRSNAIGEDYLVSGLGFFTIVPCGNCLNLTGYDVTPEGAFKLVFEISHPFPKGTGTEPTAANRLDLDVFDLAMVVVNATTGAVADNFPALSAKAYTGYCANADGYTTELANVIGDTAAMPFVLVVDDSGGTSTTNNRFEMGTEDVEFEIVLNLSTKVALETYLTMGYGFSAKKPQRLAPKYYIPEFNRKAAWKVNVIPPVAPLTWNDSDLVTTYDVIVEAYDWQQNSAVSTTDPYDDEADTSTVFAASAVASVSVDIPGMNSTAPEVLAETSGTGTFDDPLIYTVPVANANGIAAGTYTGLVEVLDERPTLSAAQLRDYLIDAPDGITLNPYDIPVYATYQTFIATVLPECGPITGGYIVDPPLANYETIYGLADGQELDITVTAVSGGSGNIVQYDADFDYDGVTFVSDATSGTGVFLGLGPIAVPAPCADNSPMAFQIAFQATDDCAVPNTDIIAIYNGVSELCKADPVGDVTIQINRTTATYHLPFAEPPWTLNWAAVPGAAEYAVYVDTVPGDWTSGGWTAALLTDALSFVGVTTTNSFDVPFDHYDDVSGYIVGNTYIVRARSAVGVGATESDDSEPAFIMTNGFETCTSSSQIHPEGWRSFTAYYSTTYYYSTHADSYRAYGSYRYRWGFRSVNYYGVPWAGMVKSTPLASQIPDATSRYLDSSIDLYQMYTPGGIFMITMSAQPAQTGFTATSTAEHVDVYTASPYYGYPSYQSVINGQGWTGVPSANNCWLTASPNRQRVGADVDASGTASDRYVGFAITNMRTTSNSHYPGFDEFALMIY